MVARNVRKGVLEKFQAITEEKGVDAPATKASIRDATQLQASLLTPTSNGIYAHFLFKTIASCWVVGLRNRWTRNRFVRPTGGRVIIPGETEGFFTTFMENLTTSDIEKKWQRIQRKIDEWWLCNPEAELHECPYLESFEGLWEDRSELAFIIKYTTKENESAILWIKPRKEGLPFYRVHHVARDLLEMIAWHNLYKSGYGKLGYRVKKDGTIEMVGQP